MLRSALATLLTAVLLIAAPAAAPARAQDDGARDIVTRAVKAHGGKEALEKYKALKSKNKGTLTLPNVGEVEFTQQVYGQYPDKLKDVMGMSLNGQDLKFVTVMNGNKLSIDANGMDVPVNETMKKAMAEGRYMLKVGRLTDLLSDKSFELKTLKPMKIEGNEAVGVRVSSKGNKDVDLYFDKKTNMLAMTRRKTLDAQTGTEVTEERIFLEYGKKTKEGLTFPKKVMLKRDGKKFMEMETIEATPLEKLDAKEFKTRGNDDE